MYDSNTAGAIKKLMDIIEGVLRGLEQNGYTVYNSFDKRWWEGEYGGYIQIKDHPEEDALWFGLWHAPWMKFGKPLCFGVHIGHSDPLICSAFKRLHPNCIEFPTDKPSEPYGIDFIEKDILMSHDVVSKIVEMLDKDLQSLKDIK